jgi:hypothetical protein
LPAQSEALVIVEQVDGSSPSRQALDAAVRAYYQGSSGDAEDDAWGNVTASKSSRAWDED